MILSRKILRKMILFEAKRVLSSDYLFESFLNALLNSDDMQGEIDRVKKENNISILDDLIKLDEFKSRLRDLDDTKVLEILGKIRGSVTASTFSRIKSLISRVKPELKEKIEKM